MARDVIDRLDLRGDERVLDAGCGTGRVTALLLERLPHGHVIAVDGSEAMVQPDPRAAGSRLSLPTSSTCNSTNLWTRSSRRPPSTGSRTTSALFARLFGALKPGGRLAAQCGGAGNIANVQAAIDAVDEPALRGWAGPWNYATPGETGRASTPASPTSGPGCSRGRSSPRTRTSTSRP